MSETAPKLDETQGIRPFFPGLTDTSGLFLKGMMGMFKTGTRDHFRGFKVDVHTPVLVALSVVDGNDTTMQEITDQNMLERLHKRLHGAIKLPLHEMLTEVGTPLPEQAGGAFRESFDRTNILVWNDSRFTIEALLEDNDALVRDMNWIRFSNSSVFDRNPCERDFFESVHDEFVGSRHFASMEMSQYYEWLVRSLKRIGDDGKLLPEAISDAVRIVDTLSGNGIHEADTITSRINSNL